MGDIFWGSIAVIVCCCIKDKIKNRNIIKRYSFRIIVLMCTILFILTSLFKTYVILFLINKWVLADVLIVFIVCCVIDKVLESKNGPKEDKICETYILIFLL